MNKIELIVTECPDVAGSHACKIHLRLTGDRHKLSMLLAAVMAQNPAFALIAAEAVINLDNVTPVRSFTDN